MHMVRYTIKAHKVADNERLVQAIFDELADVRPAGLHYAAVKLADGRTFVHLIAHDAASGRPPGGRLDSLRAFHAGLRERCEEAPAREEVTLLGAYGLLETGPAAA